MNEKNRLLVLRLVLLLVATTHLLIGIAIMIGSKEIMEFFAQRYEAARVPAEPYFFYILKPLDAYMLAMGFLAGAAFYNPGRNRIAIDGLIFLLVLRVVQRGIFGNEAQEAFGISAGHLILQS